MLRAEGSASYVRGSLRLLNGRTPEVSGEQPLSLGASERAADTWAAACGRAEAVSSARVKWAEEAQAKLEDFYRKARRLRKGIHQYVLYKREVELWGRVGCLYEWDEPAGRGTYPAGTILISQGAWMLSSECPGRIIMTAAGVDEMERRGNVLGRWRAFVEMVLCPELAQLPHV